MPPALQISFDSQARIRWNSILSSNGLEKFCGPNGKGMCQFDDVAEAYVPFPTLDPTDGISRLAANHDGLRRLSNRQDAGLFYQIRKCASQILMPIGFRRRLPPEDVGLRLLDSQ
jgi:hypothetical protein